MHGVGPRVLVVDDDAAFRSFLRTTLLAAGFQVVGEARNGAEGVRLAAELAPDVITMDLEMPVLNGVAATAELSRRGGPPVVIVSGSRSSDHLGDALRAGARWHLAKRDAGDQLVAVLTALVDRAAA